MAPTYIVGARAELKQRTCTPNSSSSPQQAWSEILGGKQLSAPFDDVVAAQAVSASQGAMRGAEGLEVGPEVVQLLEGLNTALSNRGTGFASYCLRWPHPTPLNHTPPTTLAKSTQTRNQL